MKRLLSLAGAIALSSLAIGTAARAVATSPVEWIKPYKREPLQDIVTWDEHSLFVHGKRIFFYSGEVHPYRLPVPDLWLDVFQKIKSLGYTGVSFYVDWALLEGKQGEYRADGVFALEPFFEAATKAGIYLLARPGPYINAEVSGGGFPGWLQRLNGTLRASDTKRPTEFAFLKATDLYVASVGKTIAKAQITNGGPVILVQPENEYTGATADVPEFPDPIYMQYLEDQLRNAGIVVPFISNDASIKGHNAPGQPAAVDIYGHDSYPVGFDCANPTVWPDNKLDTTWRDKHMQQSPSTPYSIPEFQGGSFDAWGGNTWDKCDVLVNQEFGRVFNKHLYSFGITILNIYMTFGGSNWGNLGHPGGYSSYDYSAAIREDRRIDREKYSEQKLQANFFKVSTAYLDAARGNNSNTTWTNTEDLNVTPAFGKSTGFYFLRHAVYNTPKSVSYKLNIKTLAFGNITVPQVQGTSLTLSARDSKIHVSDYDIGGATLVYSTAEVFTWHKYDDKTVLVLYGGPGETHEFALAATAYETLEGQVKTLATKGHTVFSWKATEKRKVVKVGTTKPIYVYLLDRNTAYNYWSIDQAPHDSSHPIILSAGYLVRTAKLSGTTLSLTGDMNSTIPIEIIGGAPATLSKLTFNGQKVAFKVAKSGTIATSPVAYPKPKLALPKLNTLKWKYIDTLPELSSSYDDSAWTPATLKKTYNSIHTPTTPTSLFASDYGFHAGTLLYRGSFTASGAEKTLFLFTQGGFAFGASAWINEHFLGSWVGYDAAKNGNSTLVLPNLRKGKKYVVTVVIDNMGLDDNWVVGEDKMKTPRGILNYKLDGHAQSDVTWKLTGNLGGEDYRDLSRGPLNEGGLFAERLGLHLPGSLAAKGKNVKWKDSKGPVTDGIAKPGIGFFATEFDLALPSGYDIPLSFTFANATASAHAPTPASGYTVDAANGKGTGKGSATPAYRVQFFVNGWQFGKYVNNIGPQLRFPVPEGILNYHGKNYLAVTLWGLEEGATRIQGLELGADAVIWSGRDEVRVVDGLKYEGRKGAY